MKEGLTHCTEPGKRGQALAQSWSVEVSAPLVCSRRPASTAWLCPCTTRGPQAWASSSHEIPVSGFRKKNLPFLFALPGTQILS